MKLIKIYNPVELRLLRKEIEKQLKTKVSQTTLAINMGLSPKSYMMITKYERGDESQLTSWRTWENLQDYLKINNIKG